MLKIAKSLFAIVAVAAIAAGSTGAYFSSNARIYDNTFSTGVLEIRVNGQPAIAGANFTATAPGQIQNSPEYHVNNYGPSHFAGPSNLAAKKLFLSVRGYDQASVLWDKLMIKVEVNRGWATWHKAYEGKLDSMGEVDLLSPRWTELAPGHSEMLRYEIWLPSEDVDQSDLMGMTASWDFVVEGRTN